MHAFHPPPPHLGGPPIPHGYQYPPTDFTSGGIPPSLQPQPPPAPPQQPDQQGGTSVGRTLSQSKRAEQNRKAQRAFRERRDQHVKALESRSQLLDAALASADEANRRWEECRTLVDQLRIENTALRAALNQMQAAAGLNANPPNGVPPPPPIPTSLLPEQPRVDDPKPAEGGEGVLEEENNQKED
ncbi:hypothetical protein BKA93DRAFT_731626 [Sparassis latifolia]